MRLLQVEKARSVIREGERLTFRSSGGRVEMSSFQAGIRSVDAKILDGSIMVDELHWQEQMKSLKSWASDTHVRKFCYFRPGSCGLEQVGDASYINQLSLSAKESRDEESGNGSWWTVLSEWSEWFSSRLAYCCSCYLGNHEKPSKLASPLWSVHHWDDSEGLS